MPTSLGTLWAPHPLNSSLSKANLLAGRSPGSPPGFPWDSVTIAFHRLQVTGRGRPGPGAALTRVEEGGGGWRLLFNKKARIVHVHLFLPAFCPRMTRVDIDPCLRGSPSPAPLTPTDLMVTRDCASRYPVPGLRDRRAEKASYSRATCPHRGQSGQREGSMPSLPLAACSQT